MQPIQRAQELMASCGTEAAVLPPTTLFNEGWLLRLVLDWHSRNRGLGHLLKFDSESTWASEVLLPSRFFRDPLPEGWTHADAVVGNFKVRRPRGDVELDAQPRQFIVIEAKMGSPLSPGTKYAPAFNQAARNVACMLHMLAAAAPPQSEVGFLVFAPRSRIREGLFKGALDRDQIEAAIRARSTASDRHPQWCDEIVAPTLARMRIEAIAWEDLIHEITMHDQLYGSALGEFYEQCRQYNGLPEPVTA